jgi:threonine dehydrogenase-like Zn-dependent dehydrogenase
MVLIITKEINFNGSFAFGPNGEDFKRAAEMVNTGVAKVRGLITDLVGLEDVVGAFAKSEKGGETVKVMFKLPESGEARASVL